MLITLLLYVPSRRGRECFVPGPVSKRPVRAERDRPNPARRVLFVNHHPQTRVSHKDIKDSKNPTSYRMLFSSYL